ncbi:hypothetical protein [Microbacterium sp. B35-30]|uniref:hypothetical protein n=1 Tax=Microbacterium sp. B35-30 TaxID=1962642 RepID=UPI0013CFE3DD|nr:hypothetical protein [Microbacterium sp. B35-30]KAF2420165.1 hypothetical protein B2K11_02425 [Microbacterium sp. B35-30]
MAREFHVGQAFTTGQGLRAGFSRRDLDGPLLERPFHGLRSTLPTDALEPGISADHQRVLTIERNALRFAAYMSRHEFFSHTTAALLWRIPLPRLDGELIEVSVNAPHRAPRGSGVHGHQLARAASAVVVHPEHGVRLTSPAVAWSLLGHVLRYPYDLVATADAIVRVDRIPGPGGRVRAPALASLAELEAALVLRRKGVVALRDALPRVRRGVASRPETWMRLTLVDGGLSEPETDLEVYDDDGRFIGCVDLAYSRQKIAFEYEGDHHRTDTAQWNRDIEKYDALVRAGWRVIRVTARMLFAEPHTLLAGARHALSERR